MKPYWSLFLARGRTLLQYRMAALAGICTQWVFGYVMISVLIAFYANTTSPQPMTLAQVITYTWVGQAMLGMLPWNIDRETGQSIRTGNIAYDLARPLDLYTHWYARAMALRVAPTLLKSIPMFIIATFLLPEHLALQWPALPGLFAWLAATLGALLLSCSLTVLMQSTLFWTVTGDGITRIAPHFVTVLSGMVIPLPLFPDWMQTFLRLQPFSGLVAAPLQLFCGVLPAGDVLGVLALQLSWTGIFVLAGRAVVHRGMRKLTVVGG